MWSLQIRIILGKLSGVLTRKPVSPDMYIVIYEIVSNLLIETLEIL